LRLTIRPLSQKDGARAGRVFFDAVHQGAADVYTQEQRDAWAGAEPDLAAWRDRLVGVDGFAAEVEGEFAGFMTLDQTGYIDLAFVRPDVMGRGVGRALYNAIEQKALAAAITMLTTKASLKARPFFKRMGWQVEREQTVEVRGVLLTNYRMVKSLEAAR